MSVKINPTAISRFALSGSVLAGLGASVCCLGPLLLLMMGISGAWIEHLAAFERFRPYLIVLALTLMALAGWRLFAVAPTCGSGPECGCSRVRRRQRRIFWIVLPLVLFLLASPWILPLILR